MVEGADPTQHKRHSLSSATDNQALKDIQKAWKRSHDVQHKRNLIYERIWQSYKGYNSNVSDPYRSNLVTPTLYAASETVTPRITKAIAGKRPYVPIKSDKNIEAVKPIEQALDTLLYWAKFKVKIAQITKATFNFGTSFIEPIPYRLDVTERQMQTSTVYPWQEAMVETEIPRFRFDLRTYMPWQVYVEPHMVNMESEGYIIIVEIVAKSEIERLIKKGRYDKISDQELSAFGDPEDKQFSTEMLNVLKIDTPDDDQDYGVLMRFQHNDKYIHAWNGTVLLKEEDNPYDHKKINTVRCAWNLDPMLQNSFWGQPEVKAAEALIDKYDESFNQLIENGALAVNAVIGFKVGAVNPNNIVFAGGARIPIKDDFKGSISDAVELLESRGLPSDAYQIPAAIKAEIDRAMGVHLPDYQESGEGPQTATEVAILSGKGDERNENRTEMFEAMGMTDLADKCTAHMDQFMSMADLAEIVGPEMAQKTATLNPYMVPGNFDYQFKGSSSFIQELQKREQLQGLMTLLGENPSVKPGGIARVACARYGLNEEETNQIVMTEQEEQQAQQAAMQAEQQQMQLEEQKVDLEGQKIDDDAELRGEKIDVDLDLGIRKIEADIFNTLVSAEKEAEKPDNGKPKTEKKEKVKK